MSGKKNQYDHVYLINRDQSTKRLESVSKQLKASNIEFERFAAVDGVGVEVFSSGDNQTHSGQWYYDQKKKLELNILHNIKCNSDKYPDLSYEIFSKKYGFVAGELGLWCSNLALWQDAISKSYDKFVVFQDDIKILNPAKFNDQLNNYISHLPTSFDVAFIDLNMKRGKLVKLNSHVSKMADNSFGSGAWAVIYNAKALEKVHNFSPYCDNDDMVFVRNRAREKEKTTDHNFEVYVSSVDMIDIMGQSEMDRFDL